MRIHKEEMGHRITIRQSLRSAAACLLTALLLLFPGCGERQPDPDIGGFLVPDRMETTIDGRLYSRHPVLLLPGTGWHHYHRAGRWVLDPVSTLTCCILHQPEQPLTVNLRLGSRARDAAMNVFWDGVLLERFDSAAQVSITLEPQSLTPGVHLIRLEYEAGTVGVIRVMARLGHQSILKGKDDLRRLSRLNRLAESGVMPGTDPNQLIGGFAFYGPLEVPCHLPSTGGLSFSATVQNHSGSDALFRVGAGGVEALVQVAAGQEKPVTLRVPRQSGRLTFAVEGEEGGLFFWGEPWLQTERPRELAPLILVTLDTTRRDAVSPFPGRETITPVLARLCSQATVFPRALAVSPWTLPTHASIFTGFYPSRHGAGVSGINLDDRFVTLAERLRAHGYFTAGFAGGPLASSRRGLAQGFCRYRDPGSWQIPGDHLTDHALSFLENVGDRPFFLFLNYFDPHAPYNAPRSFRKALGADLLREEVKALSWWQEITTRGFLDVSALERRSDPLPTVVLEALEADYLAEVSFMDHQLGRLFEALRSKGLYDKSLIVVVGDHGEFLGEKGRFGHNAVLDPELTEIPLIVKKPGQLQPQVVETPVSQVDLYSTVLAAAGIMVEPGDGIPLPEGSRGATTPRSPILLEEHQHSRIHNITKSRKWVADHLYGRVDSEEKVTVWDGGQEAWRWRSGRWQDAEDDAGWEENLRAIIHRLRPAQPFPAGAEGELGEEEIRQLQLLGYLDE